MCCDLTGEYSQDEGSVGGDETREATVTVGVVAAMMVSG